MYKIIISDDRDYRGPTHFAKTSMAQLGSHRNFTQFTTIAGIVFWFCDYNYPILAQLLPTQLIAEKFY